MCVCFGRDVLKGELLRQKNGVTFEYPCTPVPLWLTDREVCIGRYGALRAPQLTW